MARYNYLKQYLRNVKRKGNFISNKKLNVLLSEEKFKLDIQFYTYRPYNKIFRSYQKG